MKKTLLLTATICLALFTAKAQLADSRWTGTIKIPMQDGKMHSYAVICTFQKDTMSMVYPLGTLPTDVMSYTEENNVISIKKVRGGVPCDVTAVGKYSYEMKGGQLFLKMIQDDCPARGGADVSAPFDKVLP